MRFIFFFLIIIFFIVANETKLKKFINFTEKNEYGEKLNPEDYKTFGELKRWANFQNLSLLPDSPKYGLKDGIARIIPVEGLNFYLTHDSNIKKTIYVYFDFTTYQNIGNKDAPIRSLSIFVNDKQKSNVVFDKDKLEANPFRISIDPSEVSSGRINLKLVPDSLVAGRFFGIWDVFYSYSKE